MTFGDMLIRRNLLLMEIEDCEWDIHDISDQKSLTQKDAADLLRAEEYLMKLKVELNQVEEAIKVY